MTIAIILGFGVLAGAILLLWRKTMKMTDVIAAVNAAREQAATVRAQYQTMTGLVASLQTASSTIIAALQNAGVTVSPEVEAAVKALNEDGKATLAMLEIMNADADKLSQVTDAMLAGAKPQGDKSA